MLHLPGILTAEELGRIRALLTAAVWVDGRATAGNLSHQVKDNRQAEEGDPAAAEAASVVLQAVERHPLFVSAALPARISPPLFNRYAGGQAYGAHIDGAIRPLAPGGAMRTDLSATLFLNNPDDYEGGELQVEGREGRQSVKLPAGDMVLYDSGAIHQVTPVTRGVRLASFFWVQSYVRRAEERGLLFNLDSQIQTLRETRPDDPLVTELTAHYHSLLRLWAEV